MISLKLCSLQLCATTALSDLMQNLFITTIKNRENNWLDTCLLLTLSASIISFMSIKGGINTCYFITLALSLFYIKQTSSCLYRSQSLESLTPIIIALSLPIFAVFIGQMGRQEWLLRAYDAPSRMFLSIPILFLFTYKQINFSSILGLITPLALFVTLAAALIHPHESSLWPNRYTTSFVDPNSLGTYSVVLTGFCLTHLDLVNKKSRLYSLYLSGGFIAGLWLIMGSSTRISWLSLLFIFIMWYFFNRKKLSLKLSLCLLSGLTLAFIGAFFTFPPFNQRILSIFHEIISWLDHSNLDTSAGLRLSIWKISWQLFIHNPVFGYGDAGYDLFLNKPWFSNTASEAAKDMIACCGAHNELIANLLQSGIAGGISTVVLFIFPMMFFKSKLNHSDQDISKAAQMGVLFMGTLLICSSTLEVFHLKYLSTFSGWIIAGFSAQMTPPHPP